MSRLHTRIASQAANHRQAMGAYHPHGTTDTPMMMPMTRVLFNGGGADVEQMLGITTPLGAVIPATAPGRFGQVTLTPSQRLPSPAMWH